MKIIFKDFKKEKIELELELQDTILDAKQKLAALKGIEASQLKFVYSGKVLQDEKTIENASIKPEGQVIFMIAKPKKAPIASTSATASTSASSKPAQAASAPANQGSSTSRASNIPPAANSSGAQESAESRPANFNESTFAVGQTREIAIQNIMAMGFDRPQVEQALRAAFNNPDRAVEYLVSGMPIPTGGAANQASSDPTLTREGNGPSLQESASQPQTSTQQHSRHNSNTDDIEEPNQNLFEAAAAAAASQAAANHGAGADRGMGEPGAQLRLQQLREAIQNNPEILEPLLAQISHQHPQLNEMIQNEPEELFRFIINTGILDEDDETPGNPFEGQAGQVGQVGQVGQLGQGEGPEITVTREDQAAIDRLTELGFERDLVFQVYFACEKNEEVAANVLFNDHAEQ